MSYLSKELKYPERKPTSGHSPEGVGRPSRRAGRESSSPSIGGGQGIGATGGQELSTNNDEKEAWLRGFTPQAVVRRRDAAKVPD